MKTIFPIFPHLKKGNGKPSFFIFSYYKRKMQMTWRKEIAKFRSLNGKLATFSRKTYQTMSSQIKSLKTAKLTRPTRYGMAIIIIIPYLVFFM
jgi:hypothetical protein